MPWCDDCSKFWSPNSVPASGACPGCGRPLGPPSRRPATATEPPPPGAPAAPDTDPGEPDDYKAPWHFKLMVVLAVVYLGWRFIQLLGWLV